MKRYFIVGTDTDCGKTYVTCRLLDYFKAQSKRIMAIKPVASGCIEQNGHLVSEDVLHLQRHNRDMPQQICGWQFKPPISPHLAAAQAGQLITSQAITDFCNNSAFTDIDYLLIEGAGGLMAPINSLETWIDFLTCSKIPVILVVGMQLGCLNHALLTELALKTHQIQCVGWIANCIDNNMLALQDNVKTLSQKIKSPLLAIIPFGKGLTRGSIIDL